MISVSGDQSPAAWETVSQILAGDGDVTVNLATALAAERRQINVTVKPLKTIVQLFEEIDGRDVVKVVNECGDDVSGGGIGTVCCLCTERSKGAALIPCGHTYCRVCCGVMWRKRESCPLRNRSIMDVLEIL
ncbi:uncharacterized protein LOC143585071 [Bidens hawaiensis]|uniref:uncharacterized protein LOC143585071 n=1 Tax=Bidens hawaiensis TaxID=980011 RepID=UPI00404B0023